MCAVDEEKSERARNIGAGEGDDERGGRKGEEGGGGRERRQ